MYSLDKHTRIYVSPEGATQQGAPPLQSSSGCALLRIISAAERTREQRPIPTKNTNGISAKHIQAPYHGILWKFLPFGGLI